MPRYTIQQTRTVTRRATFTAASLADALAQARAVDENGLTWDETHDNDPGTFSAPRRSASLVAAGAELPAYNEDQTNPPGPVAVVFLEGGIVQDVLGDIGRYILIDRDACGEDGATINADDLATCHRLGIYLDCHGLYVDDENPATLAAAIAEAQEIDPYNADGFRRLGY